MSIILKVYNTYTLIEGSLDSSKYKLLKKALGYKDPQAMWKNSNGKWDGTISTVCYNRKYCKCYIKKDGTHFPTGLLRLAREFFDFHKIPYTAIDNRIKVERTLNLEENPDYPSFDYQKETIEKACKQTRGIIKAATGSGKTKIGAGIISKLGIAPFVFYVPSKDLLKQAKEEIEKFTIMNGSSLQVGIIGDGKCDIKDINVMTMQTAVRAIGCMYESFDDEEDEDKDKEDEDLLEKREEIYNLIYNAKGIIGDECHCWAASTCQAISDHSVSAKYKYGLSVGPQSFVELKGYSFGKGFHGCIESAWELISKTENSCFYQDYEIINVEKLDIQSRGWDGKEFCWKKINKFIRHIGPKELYSIRYRGGQSLQLTGDHSIFRVEQGDTYEMVCGAKKFYGKINEIKTEKLLVGDILVQDNGNNWGGTDEILDVIDCLYKFYHNPNKIRIRCDLSSISHEQLKISKNRFYKICNKNPKGSSVNILQYIEMQKSIKNCPTVDFIYTEGARGNGISRFIPFSDLSYLLGFYIGDGWIDGNRINFAVENDRINDFLERISSFKWLVCNPSVREMKGKSVEIRISNALLVCVIKQILKISKCYDKRLSPEWIMSWSKENRRNLLEGLIDSDGCRTYNKKNKTETRYTTTSFGLSQDIMSLIRSLGGKPSISIRKPEKGGIINGREIVGKRPSYQIIWSMSCLDGNIKGHYCSPNKFLYKESLHEARIREIEKVPFSGYVYDFEMEDHPSFVANGLLVHNSATPFRDLGDDLLIEACFGKTISDIRASFLIEKGFLVQPTIYFIHTKKYKTTESYQTIYKKYIVENEERNELIKKASLKMADSGRNVLILIKHIPHGEFLEDIIPGSFFIHGSHSSKDRSDHIEKMRNGKANITISTSIFDQGVDVKPLDGLILGGSGKSATRALQRVGRVIRTYTNPITKYVKKNAIVFDFQDYVRILSSHSSARRKIYMTEPKFIIKECYPYG